MKQIIQIALAPAYDDSVPDVLYALTNDGKVYFRATTGKEWSQFPEIPDEVNY